MDATDADDLDLDEAIGRFTAAQTHVALSPPRAARLLVAIDGSNQDATALELARVLSESDTSLTVAYAYAGDADASKDADASDKAATLGNRAAVASRPAGAETLRASQQLLRLVDIHRSDLLIVSAPYLDDIETLGEDSAGETLDVLLRRCPVPVLVVRRPTDDAAATLRHLLLPLTGDDAADHAAASWVASLLGRATTLGILSAVDPRWRPTAAELFRGDPPSDVRLAGLRRPSVAGLIGALHRRARSHGVMSRVRTRSGSLATVAAEEGGRTPRTTVVGRAASAGGEEAAAVVRASRHPVLAV